MKRRITCFWIEDTFTATVRLRRYAGELEKFPEHWCAGGHGYHNAELPLLEVVTDEEWEHAWRYGRIDDENLMRVATRGKSWPTKCDACPYLFVEEDTIQLFADSLYKRVDNGELVTLRNAPVGAMWDAHWYSGHRPPGVTAPTYDGKHVEVKTPGGNWYIDGPSYNGDGIPRKGWTRTGTVPKITARASISMPASAEKYHAYLTDGVLEDC